MLHVAGARRGAQTPPPATPIKPKPNRSTEPKPFEGLTHKPHCALCERDTIQPKAPPPTRPAPMPPTNRRPRKVDTSMHFCPHAGCRYRGWRGLGNLRANGHPSGGPWRQFQCPAGEGYVLETPGPRFPGQRRSGERSVHVLACRAAGFGMRAPARVCEVAPPLGRGHLWCQAASSRAGSGLGVAWTAASSCPTLSHC